jgi:hypothetical protein
LENFWSFWEVFEGFWGCSLGLLLVEGRKQGFPKFLHTRIFEILKNSKQFRNFFKVCFEKEASNQDFFDLGFEKVGSIFEKP